jgi:predicted nuclease of predicted toxin-antitoxin system
VILWTDAHLSPELAPWLERTFSIQALSVRDVGLRHAKDTEIFNAARQADAIVMTKDVDFPYLLARYGSPPRVLWLTCGNTSNAHLRDVLRMAIPEAMKHFSNGEDLVEISGSGAISARTV